MSVTTRVPSVIAAATPADPTTRRRSRGLRVGIIIAHVLLVVVALLCLVPFVWLLRSSVMTEAQIFEFPPTWIPDPLVLTNYTGALTEQPFALYFANTAQILVLVVPGMLLSCSAAAFAFSRLSWPGRNIWFGLLMSAMMLPYAVTLIPSFIGWQFLGFIDTYIPLTVPAWFAAGGAFNIFMLRQFFMGIPADLDNAVYIDGGSPFTVYRMIVLPLNKGPLMLVGVFTVIAVWNDLLNPLIYLSDPDKFTASLGLAAFTGLYSSQWGYLMAASVVVIAPLIILFAFAQRYIMEGIALSGIKG